MWEAVEWVVVNLLFSDIVSRKRRQRSLIAIKDAPSNFCVSVLIVMSSRTTSSYERTSSSIATSHFRKLAERCNGKSELQKMFDQKNVKAGYTRTVCWLECRSRNIQLYIVTRPIRIDFLKILLSYSRILEVKYWKLHRNRLAQLSLDTIFAVFSEISVLIFTELWHMLSIAKNWSKNRADDKSKYKT